MTTKRLGKGTKRIKKVGERGLRMRGEMVEETQERFGVGGREGAEEEGERRARGEAQEGAHAVRGGEDGPQRLQRVQNNGHL